MKGDEANDRYSMVLQRNHRDGIYVAIVPELPGLRTHGGTLEEAVRQGGDAYESWVDVVGGRRTV